MIVWPFRNVTFPVGVPAKVDATVAVNVVPLPIATLVANAVKPIVVGSKAFTTTVSVTVIGSSSTTSANLGASVTVIVSLSVTTAGGTEETPVPESDKVCVKDEPRLDR